MKIENENGKGKLIQQGDEREYETNDDKKIRKLQ